MNINALDIKVGDYIQEVGVVKHIKNFGGMSASSMRLVEADKNSDYSRKIAVELENCYSNTNDRLVVTGTLGNKTYFNESNVDVMRLKAVA